MRRLLELFCGTKSVSKAVGHEFDEVISLDLDAAHEPTIVADIPQWDYTVYPPGHFHTVWASPPCTEFSCLNRSWPNKVPNLALADAIVQRTIAIIEYFDPKRFFLENPQTGALKDRPYMLGLPYIDMDYCQFSDWGYKKHTRFWTCEDKASVLCNPQCPNLVGTRHRTALGNSEYKQFWAVKGQRQQQRYSIPPKLVVHLFL